MILEHSGMTMKALEGVNKNRAVEENHNFSQNYSKIE